MSIVVDKENVINSFDTAPDKLRAEIGRYYTTDPDVVTAYNSYFVSYNDKIDRRIYETDLVDIASNQLIPVKKTRIFITGRNAEFRDQTQWNEYVNEIIETDVSNLDHQFSYELPNQDPDNPNLTNDLIKNFHDPNYEDLSKEIATNQLLNWNLVSYPYKERHETIQRIADVVTTFDDENYTVSSHTELEILFEQLSNRLNNYSQDIEEIDLKQRHIFDLQKPKTVSGFVSGEPIVSQDRFPFYYSKTLPSFAVNPINAEFNNYLHNYQKRKNIFQSIKQDLSFANRDFNVQGVNGTFKIYNLINLMTSTRIVSTQEQTNELFLLPEDEVEFDNPIRRFLDQVNAVKFLSKMRTFIDTHSRDIEAIHNSESSKTFFLGYKIEKYLDNDAGGPIQTYYTNDDVYYDTQLKYGRRYIYKTKALIGVLGSSYEYSNLFISQNETDMMNQNGEIAETLPSEYGNISSHTYKAYVDVTISPSFQIVELDVNEDEVAFVDSRTLPPQVDFHNDSKKPSVEFFLSPMFANIPVSELDNNTEVMVRPFNALNNEDIRIQELIEISKDPLSRPDYFTGIYEVYRMNRPPMNEYEFSDNYLTTINDRTSLAYPESMGPLIPPFVIDNMNGHFQDFITPNQKYYYAFRALTYHGTPSNLTFPFEVELLQDSDEYKVNIKRYRYPVNYSSDTYFKIKRIMKITPNIDRLLFGDVVTSGANMGDAQIGFGEALVDIGSPVKFKIRVTSKHTGKKVDLNLNFILTKDGSFNMIT